VRNYNFKHLSLLDEVSLSYPEIEQNILKPAIILTPISAPPLSGPLQATVNGSSGDDTLFGTSDDDALRGFEGDDILVGQAGADQLNGGVGYDFASYETSSIGLTLYLRQNTDLNTGDAEGDTFFGIEGIIGSDFDDFIDVGYNASVVGGGGDDIIIAGGGEFTPVYLVYASSDPNDYEFIHLGGIWWSFW